VSGWWWDAKLPWLFSAQRFTLLAVVVPGTIMGDIILRWMRSGDDGGSASWSRLRLTGIALVTTAFTPLVTVGLYHRWVGLTTLLCAALIVGGAFLTWDPRTSTERMLHSLFVWGGVWLMLGLFLDPFENGIRKVPDTLSYFFTITGTTSMLLVALTTIVDALKRRQWVSLLIDLGHNPLMMYVMFTVFLNAAIGLTPFRDFMLGGVWTAFARCLLTLAVVMLIVRTMSRKRIYWRT